jgi:hypothetical protein
MSTQVPTPAKPHRKLNRSAPQLKRNAACLQCRKRRIRCDAGKPHCGSCTRSHLFLARTQPDAARDATGIVCSYDEEEGGLEGVEGFKPVEPHVHVMESKGKKRRQSGDEEDDAQDAVRRLEARVGECGSGQVRDQLKGR